MVLEEMILFIGQNKCDCATNSLNVDKPRNLTKRVPVEEGKNYEK